MTTWNATVARNIYRRLVDVNVYAARARLLVGHSEWEAAHEAAGRAIAAKLPAIECFPDLDVPGDRLGLPFREVYDLLVRAWLIVAPLEERTRLLRNDFFIDPDKAAALLRSEIARLREVCDRYWSGESDCREKLTAFIDSLEAIAEGVESGLDADSLRKLLDRVDSSRWRFLECLDPEAPISLSFAFSVLFETDLSLVRAYDELIHPSSPDTPPEARRARIRAYLDDHVLKELLLEHLREKFPGINSPPPSPEWEPAPDPLPPWPPEDAG